MFFCLHAPSPLALALSLSLSLYCSPLRLLFASECVDAARWMRKCKNFEHAGRFMDEGDLVDQHVQTFWATLGVSSIWAVLDVQFDLVVALFVLTFDKHFHFLLDCFFFLDLVSF